MRLEQNGPPVEPFGRSRLKYDYFPGPKGPGIPVLFFRPATRLNTADRQKETKLVLPRLTVLRGVSKDAEPVSSRDLLGYLNRVPTRKLPRTAPIAPPGGAARHR
jgi:hypothetical protein